ncbi:hypothetical protein COV82_06445 [Candidatus Peregrinibacteria bacterium CG11_big_fil_rev_8_21_14_0_20_46_8]|nr:MAG: hypothetical protein COV82_06445 [Candidatus Peregrinibacteria bacterium CG11_big_fil_rev_8_21_14_0_20_46_8]
MEEQTQQPAPAAPAPAPAAPQETKPAASKASEQDTMMAAVSYIGPLFLLTMIARPKNKFCIFHARQSMVLFGISFAVMMVLAIIPLIGSMLTLALFALYVLAIFRAFNGESWKIPVVADFAEKIDVQKIFGAAKTSMQGIQGMKEAASGQMEKAISPEEPEEEESVAPPEPPAAPEEKK